MGVGQAHQVHHALHCAVFTGYAMQRVEYDIGLSFMQTHGDVAVHVDPGNPMTARLKRLCDPLTGGERDGTLGGPATHQDGDMPGASHCANPIR